VAVVEAKSELMTFDRGPISARIEAQAHATAVARAEIRRGLRAEFQAEAGAALQARLDVTPDGTHAAAMLSAEVSAGVRGAIAAQLDVHGLFAEAALGLEARARVRGDVSVTGEVLFAALDLDLPPHIARPARALLRRAELHAGIFAEIYLAVKAQAKLQVGGSLIPTDDSQAAAMTVSFRYGYAWLYGAGVHGYADIELPSVADAVEALVQEVLVVLDELLPTDAPREVRTALRLLLPLAASSALAVGKSLGAPQPTTDTAGGSGLGPVAAAFLRELRNRGLSYVLETLIRDAAQRAITSLLELAGVPVVDQRWFTLADEVIGEARRAVELLRDADSIAEVLPPLVQVCGALARLGDGTKGDPLGPLTTAATVAAASGTLLLDLLGQPTAPLPAAVAERIREQLNPDRGPGTPTTGTAPQELTLTVLVEYLVSMTGALDDAAAETFDTVARMLGRAPEAIIRWLWELGGVGLDPNADMLAAKEVSTALVNGLQTVVTPWVDGLPVGELRELARFVSPLLEIVELTVPAAMDPALTTVGAARLRDELDTQLTQLVGAMVVRVLDRLARPWFAVGAQQLRDLADRVDRSDPAFAEFFAIANDFSVVFRINEVIVATVLRETADILHLVETSGFDSALGLLRAFVLLPESSTERRAQLAALSGTDDARIGDAALWSQLVEAMLVDSTELAVGMIPPSIRVSTVIAVEQGPVPLITTVQGAIQVGVAIGGAIEKARAAGSDVANIIAGLLERGRIRAEDLLRLAEDLKAFVRGLRDVIAAILDTLREALWPVWIISTGGIGVFARGWYDELFDSATGLVDRLERELDNVVDAMVAAATRVAQGLGILDEGSGEDLGQLGQEVRQAALGGPGAPALQVTLGPASTGMSHAELATRVTNGAFADERVRDRLRELHRTAAQQATDAAQIDALRGRGRDTATVAADLEAQLAAMTLPAGATVSIAVEGLPDGSVVTGAHTLTVSLPGELFPLVKGPTPLVRIEVGGVLVAVDPRIWGLDERGRVRCRVRLVCEVPVAPAAPVEIVEAQAIAQVQTELHVATGGLRTPPIRTVTRPVEGVEGPLVRTPRVVDFLPWAMTRAGIEPVIVPTVLAADVVIRPVVGGVLPLRRRDDVVVAPVAGFVSSLDVAALLDNDTGGIARAPRLRQQDPDGDGHGGGSTGGGGGGTGAGGSGGGTGGGGTTGGGTTGGTGGGPPPPPPPPPGGGTGGAPPPGVPFAAVAVVPPGYVTVTAAVSAVPRPGQSPDQVLRASATAWCVVRAEAD
jgi:hypothetical protein